MLQPVLKLIKEKDLQTIQVDTENIGFTLYGLDLEMLHLKIILDTEKIEYEPLL